MSKIMLQVIVTPYISWIVNSENMLSVTKKWDHSFRKNKERMTFICLPQNDTSKKS